MVITWKTAINQSQAGNNEMVALSDSNNATCLDLSHLLMSRVLLVGSFAASYRSILVTICTSSNSLYFHGDMCAQESSVLMSHVGSEPGSSCHDFCGVPTICDLKDKKVSDDALITFHFECTCATQLCSELLLWLWAQPGSSIPTVCEIDVKLNIWRDYSHKTWR